MMDFAYLLYETNKYAPRVFGSMEKATRALENRRRELEADGYTTQCANESSTTLWKDKERLGLMVMAQIIE